MNVKIMSNFLAEYALIIRPPNTILLNVFVARKMVMSLYFTRIRNVCDLNHNTHGLKSQDFFYLNHANQEYFKIHV